MVGLTPVTASSWMGCRCRALDGEVQQVRADRWCAELAKAGLQERVATQAEAEVRLEGRAERLQLRCTQQSHIIEVRVLLTWGLTHGAAHRSEICRLCRGGCLDQ